MKLLLKSCLLYSFLILLAACNLDRYNAITDETPDIREESEYVYGESREAEPRQAGKDYPPTDETRKRALELREKMFGNQPVKDLNAASAELTVDTVSQVDNGKPAPDMGVVTETPAEEETDGEN